MGYGPLLTGTFEPSSSDTWMLNKQDTMFTVVQGQLECWLTLQSSSHKMAAGDEYFIPAFRTFRMSCDAPCVFFKAYSMPDDDEDDAGDKSYYMNCKTINPLTKGCSLSAIDFSPGVLEPMPIVSLSSVSTQHYIIPTATSTDSEGLGNESLDFNPRLRKKRLKVTVVEGRDLPSGADAIYRVNLIYKEQVGSTSTKMGTGNVDWGDSFIFDGNDSHLIVELQGIDRTWLNLNDYYHALLEASDVVTTWVAVPLSASKPLQEMSRIKLELQAEFHPRPDSTMELKRFLSEKPLARSRSNDTVPIALPMSPFQWENDGKTPNADPRRKDDALLGGDHGIALFIS